jgi:hypothetical protein
MVPLLHVTAATRLVVEYIHCILYSWGASGRPGTLMMITRCVLSFELINFGQHPQLYQTGGRPRSTLIKMYAVAMKYGSMSVGNSLFVQSLLLMFLIELTPPCQILPDNANNLLPGRPAQGRPGQSRPGQGRPAQRIQCQQTALADVGNA